ncbi:hypothetical protein QAD02_000605 [Eretmocerus hayati]|uniref:Uncharacterized protein n=1 Tax=Eretmocerus hayati TaxID=131215 RepID=A0ACC2NEN3_9HYME|nr:hypothetical protein QAD02_000605 [Eretmocerus hayati]
MPCAPDTATASSVQVERSLELRLSSAAASAAATEVVRGQSLHLGLAEHHQRVQRSELNARLLLELNRQSRQDGPASGATSAAGAGVGSSSSNNANMATATKPELRRKFPPPPTPAETDSGAGDEDIAAIAKQISDHAEAIYQTWKSRGLAPTEILNCHSNAIAADKFGTVLTPTSNGGIGSAPTPQRRPITVQSSCSPVELLAQDNNNLEKLVNNFVVEDKARIAASRGNGHHPRPCLLQSSLPCRSLSRTRLAVRRRPLNSKVHTPFTGEVTPSKIAAAQQHVKPRPTQLGGVVSPSPAIGGFMAIEEQDCERLAKTSGGTNPKSPAGVSPGDSLATRNSSRSPESNSNDASYLDEVAREEERLINALKTGAVISEEPSVCLERIIPVQVTPSTTASTPSVSTTPTTPTANQQLPVKQKPAIIREEAQVIIDQPIVATARSKFEPELTKTTVPEKGSKVDDKVSSDGKDGVKDTKAAAATNTGNNPVRPFLTRGSVAERVLIFEKCPSELLLDKRGPRQPASSAWRTTQEVNNKTQVSGVAQPKLTN